MTPEEYRSLTSAELAAEHTLTRMPPSDQRWLSPVGVRPSEDGIEYLPRESLIRGGVIVPTKGLLEDFVSLRNADSETVAAFAARHGVLGISGKSWWRPGEYTQEPLRAWHDAATRADALLAAAARLRSPGKPLDDDQRVPVLEAAWPDIEGSSLFTSGEVSVHGVTYVEPHADLMAARREAFVARVSTLGNDFEAARREALLARASRTLEDDRVQLAWAVSTWMQASGALLVLTWPPGAKAPALAIGAEMARGCLPAITVQVAMVCSRSETTRTCDGCGALHATRRQPKPGQRSFCQQCRESGVPVKLANRDRRTRARATSGNGEADQP